MCVACQQKQKMSREEYLVQRYFLGPMDSIIPLANGVNPYSLIVDYCSMNPIDSTISYSLLHGHLVQIEVAMIPLLASLKNG